MPMPDSVAWTVSIARIQEKESTEAGVHFKEVRLELRIRKEYLNLRWRSGRDSKEESGRKDLGDLCTVLLSSF